MSSIHGELSDLFFNHEHPTREAYMEGTEPEARTDEGIHQTIRADASQFLTCYPNVSSMFGSPTPDELADDFLARI